MICVAPEVPDAGSYDDVDQAIVACGINYEVYDTVTGNYHTPVCQEEVDAAKRRLADKAEAAMNEEHFING